MISRSTAIRRLIAPLQSTRPSSSSSASKTYYTLFPKSIPSGPPPSGPFHLEPAALKREFFQLQQSAHPDVAHKGTNSGPSSAYINNAYRTLLDPLSRAQYLLSLRGIDVTGDETLRLDDQALLMDVLEAQEAIEGAQIEEDLVEEKQKNEERIENSLSILEKAFKEDDMKTAKDEAVRLRYWKNIKHTLDHWEKGKPVEFAH